MYHQYPRDILIQTPVGEVCVAITEASHIYVDANHNGKNLEISGKPIRFAMHLWFRNGEWTRFGTDGRDSVYAKKVNVMSLNDEATDAQKEKAVNAIVPVVVAFIRGATHLLREAHIAHTNNAIDSLQEKLDELKSEVYSIEQEIERLKSTL